MPKPKTKRAVERVASIFVLRAFARRIALRHLEAKYSVESKADVKAIREKLQKTYGNVPDKAVRQAIHVWNSTFERYGDEGRAWASLFGVMNRRKDVKKKKKASRSWNTDGA